ncbi:hypothetical protein [Paraburkholderia strydomiana]|jgi:hypothetical protein|uniref:hypothetical protein n=1 Tax=Paraburkholderia strydomiana TaxID=1245417 RepID=UPI0038B714D3
MRLLERVNQVPLVFSLIFVSCFVLSSAPQRRFQECGYPEQGSTCRAAASVFSKRRLHREGSGPRIRGTDRYHAVLLHDEALALVQGDGRQRNGIAEPRKRMIAKRQLQIALNGNDGASCAHVLQGDLADSEAGQIGVGAS